MTLFRLFMISLLFPVVLAGCHTPLIDIDIGSSDGGAVEGGCYPPWSICPGELQADWEVVAFHEFHHDVTKSTDEFLRIYEVQRGSERRSLFVPPVKLKDPTVVPIVGDYIEIKRVGTGELQISKITPP